MKPTKIAVGALLMLGLAVPTYAAKPAAESPDTSDQSVALTDAKVLGAAFVANEAQIAQGTLAESRGQTRAVRSFAAQMTADHAAAKKKDRALSEEINVTPEPSATSSALKKRSDDIITQLADSKLRDFDRLYMKAQVEEHEHLLGVIDAQLLPGANAPKLRALLTEMREHAARHLQLAQSALHDLSARVSD
jgi:putative membrane protein